MANDKYSLAPEVETLAKKIIEKYHDHLFGARIKYLFKNDKWIKKGKVILGQAKMAAEDVRFISDFDFIIIINRNAWNNATSDVREALIDHELHHCLVEIENNGESKFSILDHDVQEFIPIVGRYGLWQEDLKKLVEAAQEESNDSKVVSE